jgi:hypothetical protein
VKVVVRCGACIRIRRSRRDTTELTYLHLESPQVVATMIPAVTGPISYARAFKWIPSPGSTRDDKRFQRNAKGSLALRSLSSLPLAPLQPINPRRSEFCLIPEVREPLNTLMRR